MKIILSVTFILLLAGQVIYLPVTALWLEGQRDAIARDLCINRGQPELMCQGSCYINQVVADAVENGPSDEMPPAASQQEPVLFYVFLPAGLFYPAALSENFSAQPYYQSSVLFFTPIQNIFRPPRLV